MTDAFQSRIARGRVRHRRFHPFTRTFEHSVTYFYLDLSEIERLLRFFPLLTYDRPGLVSFQTRNFYRRAPGQTLADALRERVAQELGFCPHGAIRVLTQLAYWGYGFNPVSFYYFFSPEEKLEAVLAEITNTPWSERHSYVLDLRARQVQEFDKVFHVSPFLDMNYRYSWGFSVPEDSIQIHMDNLAIDDRRKHFDATLSLRTQPWTSGNVILAILRQPWMTFQTIALIYLHAAVLWLKKTPFFKHPPASPPSRDRQENPS